MWPSRRACGAGYHPSWGNYGTDSGEECGIPTYYRFQTPKNGNTVFWYSFNYGNVHVVQMSTEHGARPAACTASCRALANRTAQRAREPLSGGLDFEPGSVQYVWLENDLATVNRSVTPFVVLTGHRCVVGAA